MLTTEQIAEMNRLIRSESEAGRPEVAAQVRKAMDRGDVYEVPVPVTKEKVKIPPTSGPGSGKDVWVAFAKEASDFDGESIEVTKKADLIVMLRANGIIPMPESEEDESGETIV